jgi:hypothetical protein
MSKINILKQVMAHFPRTTGKVDRIGQGKQYLAIEAGHGQAERIGQWAFRTFPEVQTYFACHEFRRARLSIYFKR